MLEPGETDESLAWPLCLARPLARAPNSSWLSKKRNGRENASPKQMPMKPSFADPLPYIATLGYYRTRRHAFSNIHIPADGEIGPQSSERVDHRKDPVYISSQELQRVTIKQAETEAFRRARAEEREALHAASLQRVKNWSNTVEGHRRAKLQQQQSKFDREEAERERIDARFAKEEMELRDEVMNRAHMQRYGERDDVKQFHSKIRLFEALEVSASGLNSLGTRSPASLEEL